MAENGVRYVPGDWNAICDVCAQKYKASEMKKRWDGLMVCPNDWEPRHPQDFLRAVPDRQAVPWSRPETPDVFVFYCTILTSQGVADQGTADCAQADIVFPPDPILTNFAVLTMEGDNIVSMNGFFLVQAGI